MKFISTVRDLMRVIQHCPNDFIGIHDFSWAPHALGDAITWQMKCWIRAIEHGRKRMSWLLIADPEQPSNLLQSYITQENYLRHFQNLFPAFLCCPDTSTIHVYRSRRAANLHLAAALAGRTQVWPSLADHVRRNVEYTMPHHDINAFYRRHGTIPRLTAPRGYERSVDGFLRSHARDKFVVAVHIRQRRLTEAPGGVHRDSRFEAWYEFFEMVASKHPSILFVTLGGYSEWEKDLLKHRNVVVMRSIGYGLAEELTLLHHSNLFLGTSSGFSAAATFSAVPYIVTNFEHAAAKPLGIKVGDASYPFALPHQRLSWKIETPTLLFELFEQEFEALQQQEAARRESMRG